MVSHSPYVLLCLLLVACSKPVPELALQYATVLPVPRVVARFNLINQNNSVFTNTDLQGRWTILFSGFTYCPDICPLTLGQLQAAEQQMTVDKQHRVIFVSVDPQRDTPQSLQQYLHWFQPDWIGLTGEPAELSTLLDSLGLAQVRIPATSEGDYSIEHSTAIVLLDPQGRMAAYWKAPLDTAQLAADFSALPAPH